MPVLQTSQLVAADPRTVAGLLRDVDVAREALGRAGHRVSAPVRLLSRGDQVRLSARVLPGVRFPVTTGIDEISADGMTSSLVRGLLAELTHRTSLTAEPGGTRVDDEITWGAPFGPLGRVGDAVLLRRIVGRILAARAVVLVERVAACEAATVVVATAILHEGRVLAAQRARPPALAGRWELPGGRVEAGESEGAAVVRECREELGIEVCPDGRLGTDLPIDAGLLRVHRAAPAPDAGEPQALDHLALRWVGPAELAGLDWVDADRAVLDDLTEALARP